MGLKCLYASTLSNWLFCQNICLVICMCYYGSILYGSQCAKSFGKYFNYLLSKMELIQ